ncbi:MAG: peptidase S8, partial [Clostridium perfringens]|nr:peptidase S8 [Clostridium perfringens]
MESTERKNFYNDKNYISFVVAYDGNIKKEIDDINDASIFFIDDNFAILSIKLQNYMETIRSIKSII